ncbi:TonB-dependent receptor [Planctomycetales bacterium ZRK34]|nr:TonB-dependent receptor [Planctomycetales bacterium ZRK34]
MNHYKKVGFTASVLICLVILWARPSTAWAEFGDDESSGFESDDGFADLSIEQLMAIQVTSVAGVEQDWFKTPSAIYVITGEDIRKSGHLSIPEALRLAPGFHVGQITAHSWAIGSRGFAGRFTNNLQVAVDGRNIYNLLFGGVVWEHADLILEDLDQIEIIRGPGATLWGANAVNGVINIESKSSKNTQGWFIDNVVGTETQQTAIRYGGEIADNAWFRVWGKYRNFDETVGVDGSDRYDDWDQGRFGARLDVEGSDDITFMVDLGGYFSPRFGTSYNQPDPSGPPFTFRTLINDADRHGAHINARLEQGHGTPNGWSLSGSYSYGSRDDASLVSVVEEDVYVDFRHRFQLNNEHTIAWGVGWDGYRDRLGGTLTTQFDPKSYSSQQVDAFIQDTITLAPDQLFAMIGSKFEHNNYTGFEIQPSGRIWWTPDDRQTLWAAISRPVKTPNRASRDVMSIVAFTGGPPTVITGNDDVKSEELIAYEAGYRLKVSNDLTLDLAGFYNDYHKLVSADPLFANAVSGQTYGMELVTEWRPAENVSVHASYSFLDIQLHGQDESNEDLAPHHMAQLRGSVDIIDGLQLNSALYYVDELSGANVPAYLRLDVGLTWEVTDWLELSVWGQNLLDPQHPENADAILTDTASEIERSVFFRATMRF